ncbi:DUF2188 domain-containing protein [Arthrobacter globiformis]|uniref:DUF2188 domain-containing protein n=1 Tax=Arthrobacter globiformis TaxID=1665 RepID=UPI000B41E705
MGTNRRIVQKRDDGRFEVKKPESTRASAVAKRQHEAIGRARQILSKDGGGELQVRGLNGQIRKQDTISPANDPRSTKG